MRKIIHVHLFMVLMASVCGSTATASEFIDGLTLPVGRASFMARFPMARPILQKENPSRETLLVPYPKVLKIGKISAISIGRTFVNDVGCAGIAAFGPMLPADANVLVAMLKKRHEKLVAEASVLQGARVLSYMTDNDAKIGIAQDKDADLDGQITVSYSVVLNTCPIAVARDHQVIPLQK
jgi:hypothetical protein